MMIVVVFCFNFFHFSTKYKENLYFDNKRKKIQLTLTHIKTHIKNHLLFTSPFHNLQHYFVGKQISWFHGDYKQTLTHTHTTL